MIKKKGSVMPSKKQIRTTPSSQRIGLTLGEELIAALDRARVELRARGRVVDRNDLVKRILSRTNFDALVDEFAGEPRIVV